MSLPNHDLNLRIGHLPRDGTGLCNEPPGTGPGSSKSLGDDWLRVIQAALFNTWVIDHHPDSGKHKIGTARASVVADAAGRQARAATLTAADQGDIVMQADTERWYIWDGTQYVIAPTAPPGSGLTSVSHDATMGGDGTSGDPLRVIALKETNDFLGVGTIGDDKYLRRSGSNIVGADPPQPNALSLNAIENLGNPAASMSVNLTGAPDRIKLWIYCSGKSGSSRLILRFNDDAGAGNYMYDIEGSSSDNSSSIRLENSTHSGTSALTVNIFNPASMRKILGLSGFSIKGTGADDLRGGGAWKNTSVKITKITVLSDAGHSLNSGSYILAEGANN